eukprot:UN07128
MDLEFRCCPDCIDVHVGRSEPGGKTVDVNEEYFCPALVDEKNRINTDYPGALDSFVVERSSSTTIKVTRNNDPNSDRGMDLKFQCCTVNFDANTALTNGILTKT